MNLEEYKFEVLVIIFASMSTVLALIISFIYPKLQILILTILTILLPVIYQIGHIYSKQAIKYKNEHDYSVLEDTINKLEKENNLLRKLKNQ